MTEQKDIAGQANTTRETVTRAISQLVSFGVVEPTKKRLRMVNREQFENLAMALDSDWGEDVAR